MRYFGQLVLHAVFFSVVAILASCGQPSNSPLKIVGGEPVSPEDSLSNSAVAIVDNQNQVLCTATPVTDNFFITAAHCLYGRKLNTLSLRSGVDIHEPSQQKLGDVNGESVRIQGSSIHENFNPYLMSSERPSTAPNDIALIRADASFTRVIPVPIINVAERNTLAIPFVLTLVGYGQTVGLDRRTSGRMQKVDVSVSELNSNAFEMLSIDKNSKMACQGDSGGPALAMVEGQMKLIGLVSRGDRKCLWGKTIMTDVVEFREFIYREMKKMKDQSKD